MYMVKSGKFKEFKATSFRDWFLKEENIQRLRNALPEGIRYIKTYVGIMNTAEYDYEIWFELDNWAALDTFRNHDPWWDFYEEKMKEIGDFDKIRPVNKFLRGIQDVLISDPDPSED
ncbi:MAG: hypothetical protein H7641_05265 [Candidatus Heimdallarchaeota archaeon]|nr:hypothetical protein [Candidatus Heimdallarchaeota archaeon]MCK4876971.1 hypothetical protein [Candidatus Heimdallarchaeota archaeon]